MLFDVIGMVGVSMIIITYGLVQLNRINVKNINYSAVNALGAGLILISLSVDFNLSAVVIEGFWLIFSLGGIFRVLKNSKEHGSTEQSKPSDS